MFKWLKSDPVKALQKEYEKKSEQAVHAQRNGNIALFAELSQAAEEIGKKIDKLKEETK